MKFRLPRADAISPTRSGMVPLIVPIIGLLLVITVTGVIYFARSGKNRSGVSIQNINTTIPELSIISATNTDETNINSKINVLNTNNSTTNAPEPKQDKSTYNNVNAQRPSQTNSNTPRNTNSARNTNTTVPVNESIPIPNPEPIPPISNTNSVSNVNQSLPDPLKASFTATGFRHTGVFTYTTEVFQGDTISFDASSSTGSPTDYLWDFGDGAIGTGRTTTHTYNTDLFDSFNVRLTVTDTSSKTDQSGGYYIHYIGVPRMLVRVTGVPESDANRYVCGQNIKAKAAVYSPWGEITNIKWRVAQGAWCCDTLVTLKTSEGGSRYSPDLDLPCDMASGEHRNYSFIVDSFTDSTGHVLNFDRNGYYGGIGALTITSYAP